MCRSIERGVFRALLNGAHFLILEDKTMKKICTLFSFFLLIVCLFLMSGCEKKRIEKDGLIFEKYPYTIVRVDGTEIEGYEVTGCYEDLTVVNIPAYINDKPIVSIKQGAFSNQKSIKEILIPSTIETSINGAFNGCNNVEKLTTPDPYFSRMFSKSLKYLYLSNDCSKIDTKDFAGCDSLLEVHIPTSVKTIDDGTNYTYIGINGHTPPGKFDNLPFSGCNPELKIYCEAVAKPTGWGEYWNYIGDNQELTVFWGNDDISAESDNSNKTPILKHVATLNKSTIYSYDSSGVTLTVKNSEVVVDTNGYSGGFMWDFSNYDIKADTKYIIQFKNLSLSGISPTNNVNLKLIWSDSIDSWQYYNVKTERFNQDQPNDYLLPLFSANYDILEIKFYFANDKINDVTSKNIYFDFYNVSKRISFSELSIFEIAYE